MQRREQVKKAALLEKQRTLGEMDTTAVKDPSDSKKVPLRTDGRPKATQRTEESIRTHEREFGGKVLHRDPTAQERLHYLREIEVKAAEEGLGTKLNLLSTATKRAFECRWGFPWHTLMEWLEEKNLARDLRTHAAS